MAHTYTNLMYHVIFSTKQRRSLLTGEIMARLAQIVGGIVRKNGGKLLEQGGTHDHVHLLSLFSTDRPLSYEVRDIKAGSSKCFHRTFPKMADFAWQEGYAAFTVSKSNAPDVITYIRGQAAHHEKTSVQDELIAFLKKHDIDYDPRYILG